jgi:hypothetical protein
MILQICALALSVSVCYTLYKITQYIQAKTDEVRVQISVYQVPKIEDIEHQRILEQVQDEPSETAVRVIRDPSMASYVGQQQEEEDYYGWN